MFCFFFFFFFFFFNDTATTEIYTLSLHDALPIFHRTGSVRSWQLRIVLKLQSPPWRPSSTPPMSNAVAPVATSAGSVTAFGDLLAFQSSCPRVRASAGRVISPSPSWATPRRLRLRQIAIRGVEGSRGIRYHSSTHSPGPLLAMPCVLIVVLRCSGGVHAGGGDRQGQRAGQGDAAADGPEVQVEQARFVVEGMVVQLDDGDAAAAQGHDHVLDLVGGHREVAVDRRLAVADGLEADRRSHPHGGRGDPPVHGDRLVAREGELVDPAVVRARRAERGVDAGGVQVERRRRGGRGRRRGLGGIHTGPDSGGDACRIADGVEVRPPYRRVVGQQVLWRADWPMLCACRASVTGCSSASVTTRSPIAIALPSR